ncbi:MAG: undecaprenyl-diphosphate phosphatase [Clostridia bacterium]|nr:undecaprenyl-diphosphate phosphatase [Clostridia bacterium]
MGIRFPGPAAGPGRILPISSSGHLLLARLLLGIQTDTPAMKMLDILLHVGTLIPVLVIFRKEWIDMIRHPLRNKTLLLLFIASLPTLGVYLLAKKAFPGVDGFAVFDSGWFLGASFLLTAVFLLICDARGRSPSCRKARPGVGTALLMGLFQGVGMIPGVSRSGSTITGGVLSGVRKDAAARFSFMMSAPAILGSLLMEGKDAIEEGYLSQIQLVPTLIGILVACVCGFLAIRLMLKIISRVPMAWFALYLAVIGILYLFLQLQGNPMLPPFAVPAPAMG